jgi:hypothetical protein
MLLSLALFVINLSLHAHLFCETDKNLHMLAVRQSKVLGQHLIFLFVDVFQESYLRGVGGDGHKDSIRLIGRVLFRPELTLRYNRTGQKGKLPFHFPLVTGVIYGEYAIWISVNTIIM